MLIEKAEEASEDLAVWVVDLAVSDDLEETADLK